MLRQVYLSLICSRPHGCLSSLGLWGASKRRSLAAFTMLGTSSCSSLQWLLCAPCLVHGPWVGPCLTLSSSLCSWGCGLVGRASQGLSRHPNKWVGLVKAMRAPSPIRCSHPQAGLSSPVAAVSSASAFGCVMRVHDPTACVGDSPFVHCGLPFLPGAVFRLWLPPRLLSLRLDFSAWRCVSPLACASSAVLWSYCGCPPRDGS